MTKPKQPLRSFQKRVRDLILQGENVILQAPTGSGKTLAALEPFIKNLLADGSALPHKCLYATPLRVLANQFQAEYQPRVAQVDKEQGTDYARHYEQLGKSIVALQTGEQPDDPQFEALLTFCTIDQVLASFLGTPYSVGRRLANVNVAAVLGSYLVMDEFHLYPLVDDDTCFGARTTVLAMLSLLQGITPFVLMTATLSTTLLEKLKDLLHAQVVTIEDDKELRAIMQGRERLIKLAGTTMSAEAILAQYKPGQPALVICNTVLRAQQRYWELKDLAQQCGIEVWLLHSRLDAKDRKKRSDFITRELGPAPDEWEGEERYGWKSGVYYGKDIIVVATQVVEVGLDISVQTLHTEIAPANSLIQRAGRCARFAKQQGHVIVYDLPSDKEGKAVSFLPYKKAQCDATVHALQKRDPLQPVGFREEQSLIDEVHTEEDKDLLERFTNRQKNIADQIFKNLKDHSSSVVTTLIRDVAQVQVVIHNNPGEEIKTEPWRYQSFSLHPASLASALEFFEIQRTILGLDWICKQARVIKADQEGDQDNRKPTQYEWTDMPFLNDQRARERALRETILVALPNQLATYHPDLGFILRDERLEPLSIPWNEYQSPFLDEKSRRPEYKPIVQRSYKGHIDGLIEAYNHGLARHTTYSATRLEDRLALPRDGIDHAIRLAIACHDLGKLGIKWQEWARTWQHLLYEDMGWPLPSWTPNFFAKTDYDGSKRQRQLQSDMKPGRLNHACESVALGSSLIAASLNITATDQTSIPLWRAACGAIARHHTPSASTCDTVQLSQGAVEAAREALEAARKYQPWTYNVDLIPTRAIRGYQLAPENGTSFITVPKRGKVQELETWLYFLIVRALRLADQRADDFSTR